jgi:hypothetical protein
MDALTGNALPESPGNTFRKPSLLTEKNKKATINSPAVK